MELVALQFPNAACFEEALEQALSKGIPYDLLGQYTLLIPEHYKSYFRDISSFISTPVRQLGDMSPNDRVKRHKHYLAL